MTVVSRRQLFLESKLPSLLTMLLVCGSGYAAEQNGAEPVAAAYAAPRWSVAFKGGKFQPDLENYADFYGSDRVAYFAIDAAYRFTNWLELGAELGYSKDEGTGFLPNAGVPGGQVEYTLVPAQLFLNLRYEESLNQLFVPYAGLGIVAAWYDQDVDQQEGASGRTDIGFGGRIGVALLLNRLDKRGADYLRRERRLKTYLFLEAQLYSAEVDSIDLGGTLYLLGLRFDFDG